MNISWNPPEPRSGFAGQWDRFIGPGATDGELWLMLIPSLAAAAGAPLYAWQQELGWSVWQMMLAALLAFDLVGGVITNATSTAKRWYHRSGQRFRDHFGFVAVHFLHPLLISWLWRGGDWSFFTVVYGYLLLAAVLVLRMPLYLQRPFSMTVYLGSLLLAFYFLTPTPGLEWFLPIFYLKLLVSHLVPEAPFRAGKGE